MRFVEIKLSRHTFFVSVVLALVSSLILPGCSNTRIPKIDPNGSGLFSADGSSTEFIRPFSYGDSDFRIPWFPKPAFSTDDDSGTQRADSQATRTVGSPGSLWVSPKKISVPVNSEVVLHAGLIGSNGQLSPARRLDFTINDDQPGGFVKAGGGNPSNMQFLFPSLGSKATEKYANVITAKTTEQVTQGTNTPSDDVMVGPGQGWVTVTSKEIGVTNISVGAAAEAQWNQQFATIQVEWIDVKWQFPANQSISAGQPANLITRIEQQSTSTPISGWTVRYRIRTTGDDETVQQVQTDSSGIAAVTLDPADITSGSAQVLMEIIRPSNQEDSTENIVGRGSCIVTWNAPGLQLHATKSIKMNVGDSRVITAIVENPGNQVARNVVLVDQSPANISITTTSPPPTSTLESNYWELGNLPPNSKKQIEIQITGSVAGTSSYRLIARSDDGLQSESVVPIQIDGFPLLLSVDGPESAKVGEVVTYRYILENPTDGPFSNVELSATLEEGLIHVTQNDPIGDPSARQVRFNIDQIPAQQGAGKAISFKIREAGQQCHVLRVKLSNGQSIERNICLISKEDSPDLSVSPALELEISGAMEMSVAKPEQVTFKVSNTSNRDLTDVSITVKLPSQIQAQLASDGHRLEGDSIILDIETLAAGESDSLVVQVLPTDSVEKATILAKASDSVIGADDVSKTLEFRINAPPASVDPSNPVDSPLVLKVFELHDPILAGKENSYFVIVSNTGSNPISNIQVSAQMSKGLEFGAAQHPLIEQPSDLVVDAQTGQISFPVITSLDAGESSPSFKLTIKNAVIGDSQLVISATADNDIVAEPVSETTTAR